VRYFPIFADLDDTLVIVSGAGEMAAAKLRLLLKTGARIAVFGEEPLPQIEEWARQGRLSLAARTIEQADVAGARLLYAANADAAEDASAAALGRSAGAWVNVVDNLADSEFITPAIVDRNPVVVAIGTEGAAPVLGRRLKAQFEHQLHSDIATLARVAKDFRPLAAKLPCGRKRRAFWNEYYENVGPTAFAGGGEPALEEALAELLEVHLLADSAATKQPGKVWIVGAGPGDPELLTHKASRALHDADVVIHDRLVSGDILELARREAEFIEVGKTPGGKSWSQDDINALMIEHATKGLHVARIKSGDPTVYGRLDEEMDALDASGIAFEIVPGITSASAGAAAAKVSMTKRGRNSSFRFITGQDVDGFAEHDWKGLAEPGAAAAIYMGVRAARFIQGRLMIHGASPDTSITAIENISRTDQKIVSATLATMIDAFEAAGLKGPAILFLGLAPRQAIQHIGEFEIEEAAAS
jgi:uroporphyrin-III C-methyltransferase/precorrin-2 dehydrogenase/sirohydrochlorin ferrochelatase